MSYILKVLRDELESGPFAALSKPQHMARAANWLRQNSRPEDPKDVQFLLAENCIPTDFLQADINEAGRRHLIFAKKEQLAILCRARTWYVDGTFKFVRHPFTQLLTINAFVRSGDHTKQVPLFFVLMLGRKTKDYKKVRIPLSYFASKPW